MNLSLFLALIFIITFLVGQFLEKIRIPWVFAALFLGMGLAFGNSFQATTTSPAFEFMAQLGMYFLLFIIGFDLNIKKILEQKKTVAKLSALTIIIVTLFGTLIVRYIFHMPWYISILVATSFSTVGEAILMPILDEFKVVYTKFGQTILGIGTIDDVVELLTIIFLAVVLGEKGDKTLSSFSINILLMALLFIIPFFISMFHKKISHFKFQNIPSLFLFSLFMIFLLIGTGNYIESGALGALLAGITLKSFLNKEQAAHIESTIRTISYGFFVPIFFVWIGQGVNMSYIIHNYLIIILLIVVTSVPKVLTMYFFGKKEFGKKQSILMGIGLSAKFSTSVVILSLLFYKNVIPASLYSALIGTMAVSQFIIPVLFSYFLKKWNIQFKKI